jgi:hypothetical protein
MPRQATTFGPCLRKGPLELRKAFLEAREREDEDFEKVRQNVASARFGMSVA